MKSGAPDTARSSRASRTRSITRRSKNSLSQIKDDGPLEAVRTKWLEILEEEGVYTPINVIRISKLIKSSPRLDIPKQITVKIMFCEEETPVELHTEGEIEEREIMKSIASLFSSLPTINVLRLVDCKLKAEAIQILGTYLTESGTIKELYLDLNPISGEDYSPLLMNTTLEVLSLKGCAISGRGAELISEKLTNFHMNLRVLNLNTNIIDDHGAIALAMNLKWSNQLICLSLAGNNIGSVGAMSILAALKEFVLDEIDLKKRQNVLFERAQLILAIVNERRQTYLAGLHPMPALPSTDFSQSRKSRREGPSKNKKTREARSMSKSQRLLTSASRVTSNGDKSARKSVAGKKDRGRMSEQASQVSRSHTSMKQPKSSVTAVSETLTADMISRGDHDDIDTLDLSDEDSITDLSRFEAVLTDDWDRRDNERRYKEMMLKKFCHDIGNELYHDPAFQDTFFSRVFMSLNGKLCSRGNLNLSHLNLAYNKINEDIMVKVMDMIIYQDSVHFESGKKKGIKVLMLEGNRIPNEQLAVLDNFTRPPSVSTPVLTPGL